MVLRAALCVGALAYVVSRTNYHDTVRFAERDESVQLVALEDGAARVVVDGREQTVPAGDLEAGPDGAIRVDWGLASLARRSSIPLFGLALLVFGIQPLLQIVRFRWMLRMQGLAADWPGTAAVCFIGNFYSYVIPGTTGGDVVRAGYLMRGQANRHAALVAIALDRLTGMAGMFALAALAGLLFGPERAVVRHVALVSAGAVLAMVVGFVLLTGLPFVARLLDRLPLGRHLQQLYEALSVGRRNWPWLLASVALTVVLQAGSMAAFRIAAVALGMEPAWGIYFVCLPISLVVAAIPIVPMGLGTLEAAMMALLAGQVGSPSQVLGLAFAMRILGLIWALPGGVLPLRWRGMAATQAVASKS